jgi:hypothetical protein
MDVRQAVVYHQEQKRRLQSVCYRPGWRLLGSQRRKEVRLSVPERCFSDALTIHPFTQVLEETRKCLQSKLGNF